MRRGTATRDLTAAAALVLVCRAGAAAQEPTGAWAVTWAQAVRVNRDGAMEIQRWGDAILVLERAGSELTGRWISAADRRVTWQVTGTVDGDRIRLRATEHDSDDPELAVVESLNWEGTLDGDRIEGEMWIVIPRVPREPARRPWRAQRTPS